MDDITKKLSELLSDEESIRQLSELAQLIKTETAPDEADVTNDDTSDLNDIMKLGSVLKGVSESDRNTELLSALKPHLKKERQERVDKAIKLLRLLAVWDSAKESGLLNDII